MYTLSSPKALHGASSIIRENDLSGNGGMRFSASATVCPAEADFVASWTWATMYSANPCFSAFDAICATYVALNWVMDVMVVRWEYELYFFGKPHLILGLVECDDLCSQHFCRRQFGGEVRCLATGRRTHVQHVRRVRDLLAVVEKRVPTSDRRQVLRGLTNQFSITSTREDDKNFSDQTLLFML